MKVLRNYALNLSVGRDTLKSITLSAVENLGSYQSEYGRLGLSRSYGRGVGLSLLGEFRHFDLGTAGFVANELMITSGVSWGSGNGRLWPF